MSAGRDGELRRASSLRRRSRCRSARGRGRRRHGRRGCRRHRGGRKGHGRRRVPDDGGAVQDRGGSQRGRLRCRPSSSDERRCGAGRQGRRRRSGHRGDVGRLGRREGRGGRGRLAAGRRCEVDGRRSGRGCGRRACQRRHCRCRHGPCRKQAERVDIPLRVARAADPELHVRRVAAAVGEGADRIALGDDGILLDAQLAEVRERHGPAVGRLDRHRLAAPRHGPRERHGPRGGRPHSGARDTADVEPAMLPGGIGVRRVERERREHGAVRGPAPRVRGGGGREHGEKDEQESTHERDLVVRGENVCVRPR